MARRLLNLRDVPEAEARALRAELEAHELAFYETPPSPFGISAGGIWIRDDADWDQARALFERFQAEYAKAARRARAVGPLRVQSRRHPGRLVGYTAAALMILLMMLWPVFELWAR